MPSITRRTLHVLVLSALAFTGACDARPSGTPVSLRPGPGAAAQGARSAPLLRVGIGAMVSASATVSMYGDLVDLVAAAQGMRGTTVLRRSYAEINDLLEQRRIDCALVCTGAYVAGRRDFGMELLAVPVFDGSPTYQGIVIVRADSGIERFEQLRGRRFAYVDPLSNTGYIYPVSRVLAMDTTPEEFFDRIFTNAHDKSIESVRAGLVDGAAVDELVFADVRARDPAAVEGLAIIDRSPKFGAPPIVVHPDLPQERKAALQAAFLGLARSERGRRALAGLGIDWFMRPKDGLYDYAIAVERRVRSFEQGVGGR